MTHADLVKKAARWLRRTHPVVATEIAGGREEPDAIGFKGVSSTMVECKASLSDFYADKRKDYIRVGDYKYILCPKGMLSVEQIMKRPGWGLLWATGRGVREIASVCRTEKSWRREQGILVSCLRRLTPSGADGVSVKFYEHIQSGRATIGVVPS